MAIDGCRRVLITGASGGIGQALVRALPTRSDLLLVGRDEARLETLASEVARPGRVVEVVAADLSQDEGLANVLEAARRGPLDGLINNAGVAPHGLVRDADGEALARTVDVNCRATVALTHGLLPALLDRAGGESSRAFLLNVASTTAYAPVPRLAVYAASKAFVLSFTEALATELRQSPIDVLALCPGATRTPALPFRASLGVRSPAEVARMALKQLGRTTVAYTDAPTRAALTPLTRARGAVSRVLDAGLAWTLRD